MLTALLLGQVAADARADSEPPPSAMRSVRREEGVEAGAVPSFEAVYDEYVDFVYRSVRRLGIPESAAPDVTQEIFLTIHRRLESYEARSSLKTWIFGVALGVVRNQRRRFARVRANEPPMDPNAEAQLARAEAPAEEDPHRRAERQQAVQLLHRILDEMDDEKREVFVLADLEQVPPAEIAASTSTKLFTVYSRLRAAREQFSSIAARLRAGEGWRKP